MVNTAVCWLAENSAGVDGLPLGATYQTFGFSFLLSLLSLMKSPTNYCGLMSRRSRDEGDARESAHMSAFLGGWMALAYPLLQILNVF